MLEAIKSGLIGLLGSKKVISVVVGALASLAVRYIGLDDATANDLSLKILTLFIVLVGAQGLTDLGKGDDGRPESALEALKQVFVGLLSSRKFQTVIIGVVVMVLVKYLKVGSDYATQVSTALFGLVATLVGAQGLTDLSKVSSGK